MQEENVKRVPPECKVKGCQSFDSTNPNVIVSGSHGKHSLDDPAESFYEKLSKFYESCGLNLVINVQKTILDLHMFYREVTQRGGFHQVTKDGRWDKIVSALKLEGDNPMLPAQLQRLYAYLLYQFEQIYNYRAAAAPYHHFSIGDCSTIKRKCWNNVTQFTDIEDDPVGKKMCKHNSSTLSTRSRTAEQKLSLPMTSKSKETKRSPGGQRGLRTGYHIFLKKECSRLRSIHGESFNGKNVRNMAIDAWRHLSESERQPYIEESRKQKLGLATYKKHTSMQDDTQNTRAENKTCMSKSFVKEPLKTDGDYHVTLEPDAENLCKPDQSTVDLAIRMIKNAPNDPIFDINSAEHCWLLNIPIEGSKEL